MPTTKIYIDNDENRRLKRVGLPYTLGEEKGIQPAKKKTSFSKIKNKMKDRWEDEAGSSTIAALMTKQGIKEKEKEKEKAILEKNKKIDSGEFIDTSEPSFKDRHRALVERKRKIESGETDDNVFDFSKESEKFRYLAKNVNEQKYRESVLKNAINNKKLYPNDPKFEKQRGWIEQKDKLEVDRFNKACKIEFINQRPNEDKVLYIKPAVYEKFEDSWGDIDYKIIPKEISSKKNIFDNIERIHKIGYIFKADSKYWSDWSVERQDKNSMLSGIEYDDYEDYISRLMNHKTVTSSGLANRLGLIKQYDNVKIDHHNSNFLLSHMMDQMNLKKAGDRLSPEELFDDLLAPSELENDFIFYDEISNKYNLILIDRNFTKSYGTEHAKIDVLTKVKRVELNEEELQIMSGYVPEISQLEYLGSDNNDDESESETVVHIREIEEKLQKIPPQGEIDNKLKQFGHYSVSERKSNYQDIKIWGFHNQKRKMLEKQLNKLKNELNQ